MSLFSALVCLIAVSPAASPAVIPAPQVELLHFESQGCSACRTMIPTVERLSKTGLAIRHIDITDEPDTKDKFRVRVVPSFVVLVDGEECGRHEGTASYDRLNSMVVQAQRTTMPDDADEASATERFVSTESEAPAASTDLSPAQIRQAALNSTVRIRVEDRPGMTAYGTGTIIDSRNGHALVITCGHLFRDSGGKCKITVDAVINDKLQTVEARVLDFDLEYEIGLLIIEPQGNVTASKVADQSGQPEPGQPLFSVGCSNGADPTIMEMQVTAIDRFTGAPNIECTGSPVEGRSGGGLFDEEGRLVAICFGRLDGEPRGAYSGLPTVHWVLEKHELTDIFQSESTVPPARPQEFARSNRDEKITEDRIPISDNKETAPAPRRTQPKSAGQLVAAQDVNEEKMENEEEEEFFTPPAKRASRTSPTETEAPAKSTVAAPKAKTREVAETPTSRQSRLSKVLDQELAKLDPGAEDADLILIMKHKGGPTAKHKVVVINDPSSDLVNRVAQERQAQELISRLPPRKPAPAQVARAPRSSGSKQIAKLQESDSP